MGGVAMPGPGARVSGQPGRATSATAPPLVGHYVMLAGLLNAVRVTRDGWTEDFPPES
jgi:hypothetical protein